MIRYIKGLLTAFSLGFLAACGGGGGGGATVVTSTETFNISQAWVNYLTATESLPFTVTGNLNGISVTGTGTYSQSGLQGAMFENNPALRKSSTVSLKVNFNGQSTDFALTTGIYVDSNYLPLGSQGDAYGVVFDTANIPLTARVGDNGVWYSEKIYSSSTKLYSTGKRTTSFVLEPDTSITALLKIITTDFDPMGSQTASTVITFRMTPAGVLTRLRETTVASDGSLTVIY